MRLLLSGVVLFGVIISSCRNNLESGRSESQATDKAVLVKIKNLDISVDEGGVLSAMTFEMRKTGVGNLLPVHVKEDGTVSVHTAIAKVDGSVYGIAKLPWRYLAARDGGKAHLRLDLGEISLKNRDGSPYTGTDYNPGASSDWRIAAIVGGTLSSDKKTVDFTNPTTELKAIDITKVGDKFDLEVPFAIPWSPIEILQDGSVTWGSSRRPSEAQTETIVSFKPLGSLIGYQLTNTTPEDIEPQGIRVYTDGFTHSGIFDITDPSNTDLGGYPRWVYKESCSSDIRYTLSTGSPKLISGASPQARYYAWVMPNRGQASATTRLLIEGKPTASSRYGYWTTDYAPSGANQGMPKEHKAHVLKAAINNAFTVPMPLELVTEYNVAGGKEHANFIYAVSNSSLHPGMMGNLRFANRKPDGTVLTGTDPADLSTYRYANNLSGLYNYYVTAGEKNHVTDSRFNPDAHRLEDKNIIDVDGVTRKLSERYYVPEHEDWWSVFSGIDDKLTLYGSYIHFDRTNSGSVSEAYRLGGRELSIRLTAGCKFSDPDVQGADVYVYALRHLELPSNKPEYQRNWYNPVTGGRDRLICYPRLTDNRFATAYRYKRIGTHGTNNNPTSAIQVESVFLGERVNTENITIETLKNWSESDWTNGVGYTKRVFPSAGTISFTNPSSVGNPFIAPSYRIYGTQGAYWSATPSSLENSYVKSLEVLWGAPNVRTISSSQSYKANAVRLFKRMP